MIKKLQHRIELILSLTIVGIIIVVLVFSMLAQFNENTSSLEKQLRRAEDAAYDSYYESILDNRIQKSGDTDNTTKAKTDAYPDSPSYAVFIETDGESTDGAML